MGTPAQNFTVQLDTASADYWVIDSSCNSTQCKGRTRKKNRFNASASRTYAEDGHEFVIEYNHQGVEVNFAILTLKIIHNFRA
jgi:cathepsin D